jgi:branched-chain amino acid transport system permease protein
MTLSSQIVQFVLSGLTMGSIYALMAFGFTIIYNTTGIFNFAQGEFAMLGGMVIFFLSKMLGFPMIGAFFLSVAIVALIGALFERLAIHPVKNPSHITLIIITIGGSILFQGLSMVFWGKDAVSIPPFSKGDAISIAGATILPHTLWIFGITGAVVVLLILFFRFTILGKSMIATSADREAADLMGINTKRMVLFCFGLSAALGALGGIIITPIAFMQYDRGIVLGIKGFTSAAIGGMSSPFGAVVAGFLLGILESMGAGLISSNYKDAMALFVLLIILFFRPSGLFGSPEQ